MNTTSKNKIMLIAVAVLVLTNLGMVAFILTGKGDKKERGGREMTMRNFLQKDVGFTDAQLQQFDTLSKQNKEKIKADFDGVRNSKQALYKQLGSQAFSDSAIAIAAKESAGMQQQMEEKMLRHFKDIRSLCTPAQTPKFDSLIWKIWNKPPDKKSK